MSEPLRAAVIGAGYWGPNLARNFRGSPDWDLVAVCDLDESRARKVVGDRSTVEVDDLASTSSSPATTSTPSRSPRLPAPTRRLALAALDAGKHVVVEKPLASTSADARRMVERADEVGRVLMVDHTYCYTSVGPAHPRHDRRGRARGHPVRRLGADQPRPGPARRRRVLGPRPARPVDPRLHPARRPAARRGGGARAPTRSARARPASGTSRSRCPAAAIAHVHVNWLSPTKIRQMVIGGSQRTLVWDDLNPQQRLTVYDRGVDLGEPPARPAERTSGQRLLPDRATPGRPPCRRREALGAMVAEFAGGDPRGPRARAPTATPGCACWRSCEAVSRSLADGGRLVGVGTVDTAEVRCMTALDGARRPGDRGRRARSARRSSTSSLEAGASRVRGARQPRAGPAREPRPTRSATGEGRPGRGRPARPRPRPRPDPRRRRRLPPGRDPDHPVRRGAPARPRGAGRRHLQRARGGGRAPGRQGGRGVLGVGVRAGRAVPDHRAAPPPQQRHVLRRGQDLQRGHGSRSFRAMYGLDYVALRYFNVYGPRMDVHGLYTEVLVRWMERIADGRAAADLRRRHADDGLRLHPRTSPARTCWPRRRDVVDGVYNVASGTRDEPCSSSPTRCCARWAPTWRSSSAPSARSTA